MDYEKAYRDALERAREIIEFYKQPAYAEVYAYAKEDIPSIFPELCEREDEKIKKAIHIYLDWLNGKKDYAPKGEYTIIDMLTWLEKQGEKQKTKIDLIMWKPVSEYTGGRVLATNGVDILVGYINSDGDCESEDCEGTLLCGITGFVKIEDVLPKPKQGEQNLIMAKSPQLGEQKLANKVEPKFKVRDWVVYEAEAWREVLQIETIESERYTFTNGSSSSFAEEQNMRLWTIEDAKDGDVLTTHISPEGDWIGMYKQSTDDTFNTYCFLNAIGEFVVNPNRCKNHGTHGLHPATKEQRDLLFTKMKEAGYEWDAEKKELRKIDNYCKENCKGFQETGKCYADGKCKAKREVEQNPSWSDEDEQHCRYIIDFYLQEHYGATAITIEWLENLKNRVQPHWKPTEDQMQSLYSVVITYSKKDDYKLTYDSLNSLYNDLKKL